MEFPAVQSSEGWPESKRPVSTCSTFRPGCTRGPIKNNTNTIREAVFGLPCDHFLNTLSIDVQDPQNKTFVASTSHTNRKLSDQSTSGPRDMPLWPCRPHDSFQLQRIHSQAYVGSKARVLRCITKRYQKYITSSTFCGGEVMIWGMHHGLGGFP